MVQRSSRAVARRTPRFWAAVERRPVHASVVVAAAASAVFVTACSAFGYAAAAVVSLYAYLSVRRAIRTRGLDSAGWRLMARGMAVLAVGYSAIALLTYAGIDDAPAYVMLVMPATYLFVGTGLVKLMRPPKGSALPWLDTLTIVYALGCVLWLFFFGPQIARAETGAEAAAAFPFLSGDLVIATLVVRGSAARLRNRAFHVLAGGVLMACAADAAAAWVSAHGNYYIGHPVDALVMWPFAMMAAAPMVAGAAELRVSAEHRGSSRSWQGRASLFAVATVPVAASLEALTSSRANLGLLISAMTGAVILMLIRGNQLVRELRDREQQLVHDATHCALTSLANRRKFLNDVGAAVAAYERTGAAFAVAYVDLDDFKAVNDTCGHQAGDELLVEIGRRLSFAVRSTDIVGRLAGDEFAVLALNVRDDIEARELAERIVGELAEPVEISGRRIELGASVGVTLYDPASDPNPLTETDPDRLVEAIVRRADVAMYQAKRSGKGRAMLYVDDDPRLSLDRLELKADIRRGLAADEFFVLYQPVVHLSDGGIHAAEALVRWAHPTRGLLGPAEFLDVAESTGSIIELGERVLDIALRQWRDWHAGGLDLLLHINVSAVQLTQPGFVERVVERLAAFDVPASALCFEVTETVLAADNEGAAEIIGELRALGAQIAVDDFGIGYSSLDYLRRFPVDVLKLDRSFIASVATDGAALVEGILAMAASIGAAVVAEGVEQHDQAAVLERLRCPYGQGYLYGRPMPGAEIAALRRHHQPTLQQASAAHAFNSGVPGTTRADAGSDK